MLEAPASGVVIPLPPGLVEIASLVMRSLVKAMLEDRDLSPVSLACEGLFRVVIVVLVIAFLLL